MLLFSITVFVELQFFRDAYIAERKMVKLIEELNNVYDVNAIPDRKTAEIYLIKLSVSL